MSLGKPLDVLTEIASKSLNNNFQAKYMRFITNIKRSSSGTALMLGRGIVNGKNKNFYNLIGKKYLNKKLFRMEKRLILIRSKG